MINDGTNHYVYDPEGRLCGLWQSGGQFTQYIYDAGGNRVAKGTVSPSTNWPTAGNTCNAPTAANGFTLSALYLRGQQGDQDIELTGSGQLAHQNIFEGGGLTATYWNYNTPAVPEYEQSYNFSDWLGTKRLQTNNNPSPETYWRSDPYGNYLTPYGTEADATGTTAPIHFTGKERDSESGNDYFGARYYGSSMGRFMSADDGVGQDPTNPQSWNLYSYVRNNPLTNTDPDGHDCVTQTRTSATTETVAVSSGTCSGNVQDGQSQTYVAGTVTGYSVGADGHSLDIGYNSYDGNSSGVTNANGAPTPDRPNLDMNYTSNAGAGVFVPAYNLVNNATGAVEGAGAAAVAGAVGAPAAAAIARWGLQRLALAATSPALVNLIKRLYQAQDEISGGTAGAVRNEVMTGEYINGGHSIKASEMITALSNLIQSGTLSGSDQMIAGHIISDLKNSLGR